MPHLSEESLVELRELFDEIDADNNSRIDRHEFGKLLEGLGADMSEDEADIGFDIIDTDNDRGIDFNEFIAWWGER
jgi:Ca2+-binding EF-hand superfamily protein